MGIFSFLKKKKENKSGIKSFKPLIDIMSKKDEPIYKEKTQYRYKRVDGEFIFNLGDKVICRSNEPDPLLVGELVSLWDNEGKWEEPIPYIKDEEGEVWGIMGIIRPYSDELYEALNKLRPLEQWNYFVTEEYRYTEEEMVKKEEKYQKRMDTLKRVFKK